MTDINSDILHTHLIINGRRFPYYNRVYFHSNENLKDIFSFIDVKDNDVLTVLGSGDQVFYLYNNGAKSVDMFDKNKLAIYYYYIRLWTIKYLGKFYPELDFNIRSILKSVKIHNIEEKKAFDYWCKYIEVFGDKINSKYFYRGLYECVNDLDDISKIKERIDDNFSYYNLDIGKDSIPTNKKYDLIYISNISDYIEPKISSFTLYRDNIDKVLKDNGKIISVNLRKLGFEEIDREDQVFKEIYDVEELPEVERYDFKLPAGKVYTKK